MRHVLMFAAAVMILSAFTARFADNVMTQSLQPRAAAVQPVARSSGSTDYGRSMMLESDRQGHFKVAARVDGRQIDFMVDTGASLVTLRESDAAAVGIRPMPADYTAVVSTANGRIKAARAKLDRIEIGDITVSEVPALVLPDEVLSNNLLGVSFLSRLRRYEFTNGRMVLEQ